MISLKSTIARLGTGTLTDKLGSETVEYLELLDEKKYLKSQLLAELVLKRYGGTELLLSKESRVEIFKALKFEQALELLNLLSCAKSEEPWELLIDRFKKPRKVDLEILLKFFGLKYSEKKNILLDPRILVKADYSMFLHQIDAAIRINETLDNSDVSRVLLHMPTGSGKTRTAMNVVAEMLRKTKKERSVIIWLASTVELCDQAADEFQIAWKHLGNRSINLYNYYGTKRAELPTVQDGILISSFGLLYQHSYSKQSDFLDLGNRVAMVVMDEAHQAIAPTYKHLLNVLLRSKSTKFLGLSATPGRGYFSAEQDIELAAFFNKQKVELKIDGFNNPIEYLVKKQYLAEVEYEKIKYVGGKNLSDEELEYLKKYCEISEQTLKRVSKDKIRNIMLLKRIEEEAKSGKKIIVFACSVEHAYLLAQLLLLLGFKAAAVTSETKTEVRSSIIEKYKNTDEIQILTNFGVLTTGFDAPKTSIAVIARPTLSLVLFSQMVGRAIRGKKAGGNAKAKIITVVDTAIPGFNSVAEAFKFWNDIWE